MTLSGSITAAGLVSEFETAQNSVAALFGAGATAPVVSHFVPGLVVTTPQLRREVYFRFPSDVTLAAIGISASHSGGGGQTISASIQVPADPAGALDEYKLRRPWAVSLALGGGAGVEEARTSYDSTTGPRLVFRGGVTYSLLLASDSASAVTYATCVVVTRGRRRVR